MKYENVFVILVEAVLVILVAQPFACADVSVAGIFGDNMVLQRGMENPIWGWTDAGDEVLVFARDQKIGVKADENGKWMVKLGPMDVGAPFSIRIKGSHNEINLENVVVGEVWICSGQSNMAWPITRAANPQQELANANYPMIRHVNVERGIAMKPQSNCSTSGWKICSPENAGEFTAVGYYFGRKLHNELNVPIGLINTTWGGTIVEAWTSSDSLKTHLDFTERVESIAQRADKLQEAMEQFEVEMNAWQEKYDAAFAQADQESVGEIDDSNWDSINAPGQWESQGYRGLDGIAWYRKTIDVPEQMLNRSLSLSLSMIDDNDRTFVNGQLVGSTSGYRTPRKYEVPADVNDVKQMTIAVQVIDNQGAGGIYGQADQMNLSAEGVESISIAGQWQFKKSDLMSNLPPKPKHAGFKGPNHPTALFNAMVSPIVPVAFKGVIWYQGESNAGRAHQYRSLFPLMIQDWRNKWEREFPFYWVQLASFMQPPSEPRSSNWAELREAQSMTLSLPQTGEAVIIDIGDTNNIHPKNKQDVGKRLAWIALKHDYGFKIDYSGPRYREIKIEGDKIRLSFDFAEGLRTSDGKPLARFEIAGENRKFVWATATIDGQEVVVYCESVKKPVAVRYAWANNPEGCNLTNRIELPASPFRTDDWPGITTGKK